MDIMDIMDNKDNKDNKNEDKFREEKINDLDKNIIQSEIEYDELFDLMAKRRQLLEKNKL